MTPEEIASKEASQLLENQMLQRALADLERNALIALKATNAGQELDRQELVITLQVIDAFKANLIDYVNTERLIDAG